MLCDQPLVGRDTILRLIEAFEKTGLPVAAAEYGQTVGVPALFSSELFDDLMTLDGDHGAKSIIAKCMPERVAIVPAPEAAIDIDTVEDKQRILAERDGQDTQKRTAS
jgi:molybdenum cofactor cytidylyltransferase